MRQQLIEKIERLVAEDSRAPAVVELDEYFDGNTQEDSIAPNQMGYGRPEIAELYGVLKAIRQRPEVQAVLVGIHDDWVEVLRHPDVWPAAENIHIYTTAPKSQVEQWIAGLAADGIIEGWPYGKHSGAPEPGPGCSVYSVCWD